MPLRDIEEYHRWVERESPSVNAQRVARHFLAEIGDVPWRAPSIPIDAALARGLPLPAWGALSPEAFAMINLEAATGS